MEITIIPMKIDHFEAAHHLWQNSPGIDLSRADEKNGMQSFLEKNPGTCFVAMKDNHLVGTILGGSDGRRGYIYNVAVDRSNQKQGVGKKLVNACLAALKESGIQKCHIFVVSDNEKGLIVWKAMDWQLREDLLILSKSIN